MGGVGLAGGPLDEITVPGGAKLGFWGGGSIGWLYGMINCRTGSAGGGGGSGSGGGSSKSKIRFGSNANQEYHTFRHVGEAGIDKKAAEDAIRADLAPKADSMPEGLTSGEVRVAGKTLRYNAFKLPDGTINVGRITVH